MKHLLLIIFVTACFAFSLDTTGYAGKLSQLQISGRRATALIDTSGLIYGVPTAGQYPAVVSRDFVAAAAYGLMPGAVTVDVSGWKLLDTNMLPLAVAGIYQTPIVAQQLLLTSSDANDSSGGLGAWSVILE